MSLRKRQWMAGGAVLGVLAFGVALLVAWADEVGAKLDEFRGVAVFDNGLLVVKSHGRHYADDGYYYGQKWQCVEFVKRFFHQAHGHKMPDVWGHAKDFWDEGVRQGAMNKKRGLLQYRNGGPVPPVAGDLVVFTNGGYGHVAIVTAVSSNSVEVIQQNIAGRPRDRHTFKSGGGTNWMGHGYAPAGWLRVPPKKSP